MANLRSIIYLMISIFAFFKFFLSINAFIKQLLEYTQSKKGEFKTLDIIESLVLESEEFDFTLNNILKIAGDLTKSDGGMIYTYDKERDTFNCAKINGYCIPPFFVNDKILEDAEEINKKLNKTAISPANSPLFKKIKESPEMVLIQREGDEESRKILSYLRDYADNIGSLLCGKIMIDDDIFGIIIIGEQYSNYTSTDLNIFKAICSFSGVLIKNIKSKSMEKERERLKNEMKIAEQIQTGILPRRYNIEGFTITAMMKPAEEVGGDYYDILCAPDGNYWMNIGDVTGHGVTAGLIMMMLQTSSTTTIEAIPDISPKDLAIICNRIIYENVQNRLLLDQFITTCFMKFNKNGFFEYSGAHEDIYIYRNATDNVEVLKTKGIWLGLMEDISHGTSLNSFNLYKGDTMIIFTDGVIEIKNKNNEQYDTKRLINLLRKNGRKNPDQISEALMADLNAFKDVQKDDITYIIIRKD
jgi:serine phosphatase RsbU (regulator of sigma subunit)